MQSLSTRWIVEILGNTNLKLFHIYVCSNLINTNISLVMSKTFETYKNIAYKLIFWWQVIYFAVSFLKYFSLNNIFLLKKPVHCSLAFLWFFLVNFLYNFEVFTKILIAMAGYHLLAFVFSWRSCNFSWRRGG